MKKNLLIIFSIINLLIIIFLSWKILISEPKRENICLDLAQSLENSRLKDNTYTQMNIDNGSLFMKNYLNCVADR